MCGFTGLINFDPSNNVNFEILKEMNLSISHRGPDDEGYLIDGNIGLGFRRLSIIDLEHGQQPMTNIEKQIWIVFNGEIYNYKEIKKELIKKGHKFCNNSDTEVIINSYKEYGEDCVNKLRGMFAFVIWDKNNKKIFMARDRFGIKPLYYLFSKNGIAFASELKALLKSDLSKKEINISAVDSFFTYGYILSPHSIYSDIKKLTAAHTLTIDLVNKSFDELMPKKYWYPTFISDANISFDDYKYLIREGLKESVEKHLVSDVPIGAFLSGGIDSSSVVSIMSKLYPGKMKTFTIGFAEKKYNEADLAKLTSEKYGTEHHQIIIDKKSALNLEKIINLYDEPFGDSSAIPTYFVSKLASKYVKVVLSGDGGDEFFGGYNTYQRLKKIYNFHVPYFLRYPLFRILSKILPNKFPGKRFSYVLSQKTDFVYAYFNHIWYDEQTKIYNHDILQKIRNNPIQKIKIDYLENSYTVNYLSRMMELDIVTYLSDDILTKVDRASMANSLEVRVPIIDHVFFELANKIPSEYKIIKNKGKYIFREAMHDKLPNEIYRYRKHGFTIPINAWIKNDLNDFVYDNIGSGNKITEFINKNYITSIIKSKNPGSMITRIWPIVVFNYWLNNVHSS